MILQTPCQRRGKVTLVAFVLLLLRIHSRIRCICLIFLHCAFSNDPSNSVPEKRYSHIGCICFTFLHCAFSYVASNGFYKRMQSRIGCTCLTFLHCAFSNDPSNSVPEKRYSRIGCICLNFLHCAFYMLPQMIFIRGRIVAYVAGGGVIPIPKTFLKLPMQWAC